MRLVSGDFFLLRTEQIQSAIILKEGEVDTW